MWRLAGVSSIIMVAGCGDGGVREMRAAKTSPERMTRYNGVLAYVANMCIIIIYQNGVWRYETLLSLAKYILTADSLRRSIGIEECMASVSMRVRRRGGGGRFVVASKWLALADGIHVWPWGYASALYVGITAGGVRYGAAIVGSCNRIINEMRRLLVEVAAMPCWQRSITS